MIIKCRPTKNRLRGGRIREDGLALIERWCDERKFSALVRVLPDYISVNGLTDGWASLHESLKSTHALGYEAFSPADWEMLNELIREAERTVYRR